MSRVDDKVERWLSFAESARTAPHGTVDVQALASVLQAAVALLKAEHEYRKAICLMVFVRQDISVETIDDLRRAQDGLNRAKVALREAGGDPT